MYGPELTIAEKNAFVDVQPIPLVEAIPGLIRQLFQNLLSNALKFSKPNTSPRILIAADRVNQCSIENEATENGKYCRITISDNGIGFEEKYADKIFTIFQRLNGVSEYEGTGIGLAIAKKIVDKHNGLITAKSLPGKGTTFFVLLPVLQSETPKSKEQLVVTN